MIVIGLGIGARSQDDEDGLSFGRFLVFLGIIVVITSTFIGC